MTRINVVHPSELCDQHLLAEYRELPRVFKLARPIKDAPSQYVLGKGHVKFFYNKLGYLLVRQGKIVLELQRRGFNPRFNPNDLQDLHTVANDKCWGTWVASDADIALNRERIALRMPKKPRFAKEVKHAA